MIVYSTAEVAAWRFRGCAYGDRLAVPSASVGRTSALVVADTIDACGTPGAGVRRTLVHVCARGEGNTEGELHCGLAYFVCSHLRRWVGGVGFIDTTEYCINQQVSSGTTVTSAALALWGRHNRDSNHELPMWKYVVSYLALSKQN